MAATNKRWTRRLSIAVGCAALAICVFIAFLAYPRLSHRNQTTLEYAGEYTGRASGRINIQNIDKLARYVELDYRLCVIRFDTDFEPQPSLIAPADRRPSTGLIRGVVDRPGNFPELCHVQGQFSEVKCWCHSFGPLGHVNRNMPISREWSGDDAYNRLWIFLYIRAENPSLLLLAESPPGEEADVLGAELHPIGDYDVALVADLVAMLKAEPYSKMTAERAETLLRSHNPWFVWLGLARLYSLKAITRDDFERVLESRPVEDLPAILRDMDMALKDPDETQVIIDAIRMPDRQQAVLEFYVRNQTHFYQLVGFHEIRKAAKEYRETIADKPDKREIVRLLDSLLSIRSLVLGPDGKAVLEDDDP